ncbi:MAG TPA: TIR domain-containing protein [Ohtaekwangia sp.]|uniref:TIR domain-containing protein n=1 Tax=Ohtaekwangia sp. TaxID=2066019 RepID=UPI002F95F441
MGGGGGDNYNVRLIDRLQKAADEAFNEAKPEKRNVFISFDHRDLSEVNLLRGQAKNENNDLEFSDYSLKEPYNSEKADYIKSGIRERIRQSSVTVVYLTENTHESEWVDWEVRESLRLGKGVICVHKGDSPPLQRPQFVNELKIRIVKWDHDAFPKAIENASKNR